METLQIKNMVCPRCISSVASILEEIGVEYEELKLGSVAVKQALSTEQEQQLKQKLQAIGFEIIHDPTTNLVHQIKSILIEKIHYNNTFDTSNISAILTKELFKDYSTLSKTFSKSEGITIEQYVILQRIERAKELLSYDQSSISEIAVELGYSSTAHFSRQFKKVTHQTPSQYKKNRMLEPRRNLDEI